MDKRKIIEWHPAFEASIQIEFENEIESFEDLLKIIK